MLLQPMREQPEVLFPGEEVPAEAFGMGYWFWCAGCDSFHRFRTKVPRGGAGPVWTFNGDLEMPTFFPSLLYRDHENKTLCHLFLRGGVLEYCGDCPHKLAGKHVSLVEPPRGDLFGRPWDSTPDLEKN